MTIAFVLGNGTSRTVIDLTRLRPLGSIYGCNGLYREFEPDCLVATDRPIAQRIQQSGYSANHRFYTRRPLPNLGGLPVPKKYHGNSSGPIATAISAMDGHRRIYMLGYDMGPSANATFNNVYAGTEFYKAVNALPTFTGNWSKQIAAVTRDFPKVQFFRVCGPTTAEITELKNLNNLHHIDMKTFVHRINTGEEL
jgi:hypothetical protein